MIQSNLTAADWIVIGIYVCVTFGVAFLVRRGQATGEDYFLAGRKTGWFLVGVSMYATLFSTISFVAMPGEGYRNGMLLGLNSVGYFLFTPLAVWIFLRFFYRAGTFTAYEYLGRRFGPFTRVLGSLVFIMARCLTGAMVFYASAKAFETLVGWQPEVTVLVVGVITVAYSYLGGMRAIIITDLVQTLVIFLGLVLILITLLAAADFDVAAIWSFARENDRTFGAVGTAEFFSLDPHLRYTFWLWLLYSVTTPLANYGTDQLVVQRLLASSSYGSAKRAILFKTLFTLPISLSFYFCGLLLYYYYNKIGTPPSGVGADSILGWYISTELPPPIPGLIAAALLAALMSTFSQQQREFGGFNIHLRDLTATCVDMLLAKLARNERGIPSMRQTLLIQAPWVDGPAAFTPEPKRPAPDGKKRSRDRGRSPRIGERTGQKPALPGEAVVSCVVPAIRTKG